MHAVFVDGAQRGSISQNPGAASGSNVGRIETQQTP